MTFIILFEKPLLIFKQKNFKIIYFINFDLFLKTLFNSRSLKFKPEDEKMDKNKILDIHHFFQKPLSFSSDILFKDEFK